MGASQVSLVAKNLPTKGRDVRDMGLIPGSRRSPGGGNGNPLQYCCLENPVDRAAWWTTIYSVTESRTWLKWLSMNVYSYDLNFVLCNSWNYSVFFLKGMWLCTNPFPTFREFFWCLLIPWDLHHLKVLVLITLLSNVVVCIGSSWTYSIF